MDLLQDYNKSKKKKTKGQKIVLTLLIISIILSCVVVGVMFYLSIKGESKQYTIQINGKNIDTSSLGLSITQSGEKYISLRLLCSHLGYNYKNGEFQIPGEDTNKGYIYNNINIIQFFGESKEIYKTEEDTDLDNAYFKLKNKIIQNDNSLYICLNDLPVALNLIVNYSQEDNQTTILTSEYFINQKTEEFKTQNITISNKLENIKALSYGYMIINKDGKYGVNSLTNNEIIGNKYNSITFLEKTGEFIVSNKNNKYGILTNDSEVKIKIQYDSIEILNYNPLLYKVEKTGKHGVVTEDGDVLGEIEYDIIGYPKDENIGINYTLIIPEINENIPESIVVAKNGKYGLIELETGEEILECNLKAIYSATGKDEVEYYIVETETEQLFLEKYVESLNRITVNMHS